MSVQNQRPTSSWSSTCWNTTTWKEAAKDVLKGTSTSIWAALFIIGCIGVAGAFPGSPLGWTAIGLAGSCFVIKRILDRFRGNKIALVIDILATATLISLGALNGVGLLSAAQLGGGIIGTLLGAPIAKVVSKRCYLSCRHHQLRI